MFCLRVCIRTTYMSGMLRRSEEGVELAPDLELHAVVSCHVGAGNQIQVFGRETSALNLWTIPPAPKKNFKVGSHYVALELII